MKKLLEATRMMVKGRLSNTAVLRHVLGSWNWILFLSQPAMPILQECYELARDTRLAVLPTSRARHELQLLMLLRRFGTLLCHKQTQMLCVAATQACQEARRYIKRLS